MDEEKNEFAEYIAKSALIGGLSAICLFVLILILAVWVTA